MSNGWLQFTNLKYQFAEYRTSFPQCLLSHQNESDRPLSVSSECDFVVTISTLAEIERPPSSRSISFDSKFKQVPDWPMPDIMRILNSYFMDATHRDRPSSPVSLASDSELVALPIDCWIYDSPRPLNSLIIDLVEEVIFFV